MNVPEEFDKLCGAFYPHSHEEYATEDEWIAGTIKGFIRPEKRNSLKRYLDELLSDRYSDADLAEAWISTSPTYNFRPGGHRIFLTKIRDCLAGLQNYAGQSQVMKRVNLQRLTVDELVQHTKQSQHSL